MCQTENVTNRTGMSGNCCGPCECGCCPPFRRYYSAEEEQERLAAYRDQLKKELADVEECISNIEK